MTGDGVEPLLGVRDVSLAFGGIQALDRVSFSMEAGQVVGLIGPNGAGKTTLFNCLSCLYRPNAGDIRVNGRSILGSPPHRMPKIGIGRTFQNVALFPSLTVRDNVLIGGHAHSRGDVLRDGLRLAGARRRERELALEADEILSFLDLARLADAVVSGLPFGTQKRVELARALASRPALLLLDEPAGGLNHDEVHELGRVIRRVRDERGIPVLLVEHHMGLVMSIADHVVVLNFGRKLAEGSPSAIQADPAVIAAYLGSSEP